jgi:hypothetical protein
LLDFLAPRQQFEFDRRAARTHVDRSEVQAFRAGKIPGGLAPLVDITDNGSPGDGIARIKGFIIFAKDVRLVL